MTYFSQTAHDAATDAGLPPHEVHACATTPPWIGWTPPAMPETCECGATGDRVHDPIYVGYCADCEAECCEKCGHTDHDEDGTTHWCATCYDDGCIPDEED